ncbi:MAG TPA: hypothetical protein VLH10_14605 [Yinghuangia sp.]|nr:hypothetical protein [Yinghuangia sp.]
MRLGRTRRAAVIGALVFPLVLSGCSLGPSGGGVDASDEERNPTGNPDPAKDLNVKLPAGFDLAKGWSVDETQRVFVAAQSGGLLLDIFAVGNSAEQALDEAASATPTGDEETPSESPSPSAEESSGAGPSSVLIARDAADGHVVWSSTPLRRIVAERPPLLRVAQTDQGLYAVVVRTGGLPANGVARARQLVVIDSFPLVGAGTERAPARHVEHMVDGSPDDVDTLVGEGGVLITGFAERDEAPATVLWDPLTGVLSTLPPGPTRPMPGCSSEFRCEIQEQPLFPTGAGMLFREDTENSDLSESLRFGVSGRWNSAQVAPQGRAESTILAVTGTAVLAAWRAGEDQTPLYAVHDLLSGAILASAECAGTTPDSTAVVEALFDTERDAVDLDTAAQVSSNGRYLVSDFFAADLSGRTATCFTGDRENRSVSFLSVDDRGVGYATLRDDDNDTPDVAVVQTRTKRVDALPVGTSAPIAITSTGSGVFSIEDEDGSSDRGPGVVVAPPGQGTPAPAQP